MNMGIFWNRELVVLLVTMFAGVCFGYGGAAWAATNSLKLPYASGQVVYEGGQAQIDASNAADGYVMVKYSGSSKARLKVLIKGPKGAEFNYDLNTGGDFEVFPLSDGNGEYNVGVYQNISGTKYSTLLTKKIPVRLNDEFAPFLIPNQYVNYSTTSRTVALGASLTAGDQTTVDRIASVYDYVSTNITYDREKAATVQSGYVPDVDLIIDRKKGICFDFASVMAAMLRSQEIPTRLVIGYAGTAYHAWLDVYSTETGWIEAVVFFDGKTWQLMDPTFASGMRGAALARYIGDGTNYKVKFYT
jgi:transglutaminase-like putative cysteine protease